MRLIFVVFRNNANVLETTPTVPIHKKEPRENIARIAKRYLDDNMQQAWINPRLISMVSDSLEINHVECLFFVSSLEFLDLQFFYKHFFLSTRINNFMPGKMTIL